MILGLRNAQRSLLEYMTFYKRLLRISNMPYYAVAHGRTSGIFMNWGDCEAQVKGFAGAKYKKFNTLNEANDFVTGNKNIATNWNSSRKRFNSSGNNLKRPISTKSDSKAVPNKKPREENNFSDDDFDTDDLQQLDALEARLKGTTPVPSYNYKSVGKKSILIESSNVSSNFARDHEGFVQVYTDGACSANGHSQARAGLGVYWGDGHSLNTSAPVPGRATNNCGEIQAAVKAIRQAKDNGIQKLAINTDSKFLINSVTKWMQGWKRKGWKLKSGEPVKNETDFKELDSLLGKVQIKWNYVEAHRGVHGNEMADQLAKAGAAMYEK